MTVGAEATPRAPGAGETGSSALAVHLRRVLGGGDRPPSHQRRYLALVELLATAPPPPDRHGLFPSFTALQERLRATIDAGDGESAESAFLELYCHLHGHEAPYTRDERLVVDRTGGYWCHAGGLAPVVMAPDWVTPATRSIDFGAGNGLQLLLVQWLAPHARTTQLEISGTMCEAGADLQRWLGIPEHRVLWCTTDATSQSPRDHDFVYLYRPVRPEGPGLEFYRRFAAELAAGPRGQVVFSVADCLADLLAPHFDRFYFDGQLACFRRRS